jgi:hypothetical protein
MAIACVETKLVLDGATGKEHCRVVHPALPECNHHTLRKLIQLDLETHPPQAAVTALHMQAQPARPQTVQQGLFSPQTPEAGRLEVLLARLRKLLGDAVASARRNSWTVIVGTRFAWLSSFPIQAQPRQPPPTERRSITTPAIAVTGEVQRPSNGAPTWP